MNTRLIDLRNRVWHDGQTRRLRPPIKANDLSPVLGWPWIWLANAKATQLIGPDRVARIEASLGFPIPSPQSLGGVS